jgi:multimeric flavodoxin WrbA
MVPSFRSVYYIFLLSSYTIIFIIIKSKECGMKVVGFNGSPRKNGNTSLLIKRVFAKLEDAGIETELVQLGGNLVHGCTACLKCKESKSGRCSIEDDIINECIEKMVEADGIILGSPTYFASLTTETKALIDRSGYACRSAGNLLRRKVGAAVVAVRRAGAVNVFNAINHFFLINEFVLPGSIYWNLGIGRLPGEAENDEEGMKTMDVLGENMAWLLQKVHG